MEKTVTITNKSGLHLWPAAQFVKTAAGFKANITVVKDGKEVNGKSILHVQSLGVRQGTAITIKAEGDDGEKALQTLVALVENNFGEE